MKRLSRSVAAIVAASAVSACGGGGGSQTSPVPVATPTAAAIGTSVNRTPIGSVTLTLRKPTGAHTAKLAATARKPKYVNPNAYYLDIWVVSNGTPIHVVDSSSGSNVSFTADGTQQFNVPVFGLGATQIVAYETDQPFTSYGSLLAIGEADLNYTAGTPQTASLTMLMNAQNIGVMSAPDDQNVDSTTGSLQLSNCPSPTPIYFFAADPSGGFVDNAGVGGVSLPIVTNVSSSPSGNTFTQNLGLNGGYTFTVNNYTSPTGVTVNLTAANPASGLANLIYANPNLALGAYYLYYSGSNGYFSYYISNASYATTITNSIYIYANAGGC